MQRPITVGLELYELRVLRGVAANQVRTPENLARYLILKGLGIVLDNQEPTTNNTSTLTTQPQREAVPS